MRRPCPTMRHFGLCSKCCTTILGNRCSECSISASATGCAPCIWNEIVMTTLPADELRSLAAGARKAAEHYREHPNEIARTAVIDLYILIARLAEQLTRPQQ